jgi:hypothetical protein
MSAADILATLRTVDGVGSELDADLLDGYNSSAYVFASEYTDAYVLGKIKNVDGHGSGLDADTLDGMQAADLMPPETNVHWRHRYRYVQAPYFDVGSDCILTDYISAPLNNHTYYKVSAWSATGDGAAVALIHANSATAGDWTIKHIYQTGTTGSHPRFVLQSNAPAIHTWETTAYFHVIVEEAQASDGTDTTVATGSPFDHAHTLVASEVLAALLTVDGSGSGLNADLLDGAHAAAFATAAHTHEEDSAATILAKLLTVDGPTSGLNADLLDNQHASHYLAAATYTAADVFTKVTGLDGHGTGLDADFVDGKEASDFALLNSSPTFTGIVNAPAIAGESVTLANNESISNFGISGAGAKIAIVYLGTDGDLALITARGASTMEVTLVAAVRSSNFSTVGYTAGKLNLYYSDTSTFVIQNMRGGPRTVTIMRLGI